MNLPAKKDKDWGELGPAMRALSAKHRCFVEFYIFELLHNKNKDAIGAKAAAARKAGYGRPNSKPKAVGDIAWRLMQDPRILAAIAEESRNLVRGGAPEAVAALLNLVRDPEHKDHARAIAMVLDRTDPITTHQQIDVTHRHVDPEQEEIEELRALRSLGTSREKLLELFGGNGLARLEKLEAQDTARRANEAKVIDAEAVEIEK